LGVDVDELVSLGVTHVLNAGKGHEANQIDTNAGYFRRAGIDFLGVPAIDSPTFPLHSYFKDAASFIEQGLASGGKVYVHCECGISRAPTLVVAFLLQRRGLSLRQALAAVRSKRSIYPNAGFLDQLIDLDYDNQVRGLTRPEPEQYSAMDEYNARYTYPLEYYHYPSGFPRVTSRADVRTFMTRELSPVHSHQNLDNLRRRIRAISEEPDDVEIVRRTRTRSSSVPRDTRVVTYRASSVPREVSPVREIVSYTSPARVYYPGSSTHITGYRTPHIPNAYIDSLLMSRPSYDIDSYASKHLRSLDFETGPMPYSTYRTAGGYYRDLPSSSFDSQRQRRIRYLMEPKFTYPLASSIAPSSAYASSTRVPPAIRRYATEDKVYLPAPTRINTAARLYEHSRRDPDLYRPMYAPQKLSSGFPTRFHTYRLVQPTMFSLTIPDPPKKTATAAIEAAPEQAPEQVAA